MNTEKCLLAVSGGSQPRQDSAVSTWRFGATPLPKPRSIKPLAVAVSLAVGGIYADALAQTNLITDGKTATSVQRTGAIVDVTTGTVKGVNAFNSFRRFEVGQPDTVNLRLPDGTNTLINMVYDAPIRIDGVLNSIKGNQIGGRVVFADPFGMVVGRTGVLNVGSLIVTSPNASFLSGVIGANGIDDGAVGMLLSTKLSQAPGSSVRIDGRINALERVRLQAESVLISEGSVVRVGAAAAQQAAFQMAVNTNGLEQATGIVNNGGVIEIVGTSVNVAGTLNASGAGASGASNGGTVRVGRVDDTLAESVDVATTAVIKADAGDAGNGGLIDIWGNSHNHFLGVASARGGAQGGDGGFVEVSANTGLLYGGLTWTDAPMGASGKLFIDPNVVCIVDSAGDACTTDAFLGDTSLVLVSSLQGGSGNIALEATDGLYIGSSDGAKSANLDLSTRLVAGTKLELYGHDLVQLNAGSQIKTGGGSVALRTDSITEGDIVFGAGSKITTNGGAISATAETIDLKTGTALNSSKTGADAGDITLKAREITVTGSEITAEGGNVTLEAKATNSMNIFGFKSAESKIVISNSKVTGDEVKITAETTIENKPFVPSSTMDDAAFGSYLAGYANVDNAVGLSTDLMSNEVFSVLEFLTGIQIVLSSVDTKATVTIDGASHIHGDSAVTISANTSGEAGNGTSYFDKIKGFFTPVQQTKFGLGVGYAAATGVAKVDIGGTTKLSGGDLTILARNDIKVELEVETANTDGPGAAKAKEQALLAIAAGVVRTDAKADALVNSGVIIESSGDVTLAAVNYSEVSNAVTASTGADGKAGAAVALTLQNTEAKATLNTNIIDAASAKILSIDHTASTSTEAVAKVGATPFQRFANNVEAYASEDFLATLSQYSKEKKTFKARTEPLKLAGALALTNENHTALTHVGDGVTIHTRAESGKEGSGSVLIGARVEDTEITLDAQASAISSSSGGQQTGSQAKNAGAAGVAVGMYDHIARATVGEGVTIVGERIGVLSHVEIPLKDLPSADDFSKESWDSFTKVKDNLGMFNDLLNLSFVNARARAKGSGEEVGFSGSLTFMFVGNESRAEVGANSKLLTNSDAAKVNDSYVTKTDYNLIEAKDEVLFDLATKTLFEPEVEDVTISFVSPGAVSVQATTNSNFILQTGEALNTNEGKGVGVSNGFLAIDSHSDAIIREGVKIARITETDDGADPGQRVYTSNPLLEGRVVDSVVKAYNDTLAVNFTIGAGKSTDATVSGMAVETFIDNRARASVDNEATVKADSFKIEAADTPLVYTIAGTLNMSGQTTIGVGIGVNDIKASTTAGFSDNDLILNADGSVRASKSTLLGSLDVNTLSVLAHTGGAIYNIAVAGSASSTDQTPGIGDKLSKLNESFNKALCAANNLMGQGDLKCAPSAPKAKADRSGWAVTGAGAVAVNTIDLVTTATLDGIGGKVTDLQVNATGDSDLVTVAGGAAFTLAKAGSKNKGNATFAGAVAVNVIGNKVESHLANTVLSDMKSAEVSALKGGENLSIGLSMAVNTDMQGKDAVGFAGSASITLDLEEDVNGTTQSKNAARAFVDNADLGGLNTGDLNVIAYNSSLIGTGGGSMTTQGKKSVGASVTYAEIGNATEVSINNSRFTGFKNENVLAHSASQIVAAAASASVSIGQKDSTGINGSIVLTNISNSTKAVVKNSQLDGTSSVTVTAREGTRLAGYESRLEQGAVTGDGVDEEGEANGYDYSGSKLFTDSSVAGGETGSAILGIAGTVQLSTDKTSKNIGASVAYNMISNSTIASVDGSYGASTLTSGTAGLQVTADSQAYIRSFAVGASAAGDVSVGGSVAINIIDNTTSATINNVKARGAQASATDNSNIDSLAGQINVSTESKGVAAGGALAYNQITNTATASVDGTSAGSTGINGGLSGTGSNVSAIAQNTARIRSIAAAGAVAPAGNANAFSGSIGFNLINNTQTATVRNVAMSNMTAGTDLLKARAVDDSDIQALSGALSIGGGAAFGGAISTNTIANDTNALIEGVTGTSVESIAAQAWSDGDIQSLAAGVAASNDKGAIAGSVAINTITNGTSAKMDKSTVSGGTLAVTDENESSISTIAGAAAVSLNATAIGVAVTTNTITNTHAASVTDSNLTLAGSAAVKATEKASIDSIGASGAVGQGVSVVGAFVVNTVTNGTAANVTNSTINANGATVSASDESQIRALGGAFALSIDKSAVGGAGVANTISNTADVNLDRATLGGGSGLLTVSALNKSKIQALAASAALAGGTAAVGIAGSANTVVNKTRISALGSSLSGNGAAIKARDESTVQAFNGAVSISLGTAAVGGAIGINTVTNTVSVDFDDKPSYTSTLNGGSGAVTVGAESDQTIEALVAAAAGSAGTVAVTGSVGNNVITNTTRAQLTDTALKGGSAAISATDGSDIKTLSGAVAVAIGSTAVGAAASNNVIVNSTTAGVTGGSVALTSGALGLSAKSTGAIDSLGAAGAVGADNAVSATLVGNTITNTTRAHLNNVTGANTSTGGSVVAEDTSTIRSIAGSAALAPGAVAVGGAAAASTITNTTEALVDGTTLNAGAGAFTHTASNSSTIKTLAAAGAGGGGVAAAVSAATNTIVNKTHALMTGTTLTAGNMTQQSRDTALIQTLSGAAAVSVGTVGVGFAASINTVTNENWSGATGSNLTLSGTLTNDTRSTENIDSIAVAMSAAGGAAVSPSVATNTITNSTQASYGTTSVSSTGTTITATDNSAIRNLTGAAAIDFGGGAAVGGAGSINTIKNSTQALVTGGTWGTGAGSLSVSALNSESIKTIAASAAVSANVGVAGSIVTGVVNNVTRAKVSGATVTGAGLTVKAEDKANIDMVAGALGIGVGAAGVGAALNGVGIANTVEATLHNTSAALGSGTGNVSALSQSTINSLAVAGAGSSGVSVGGSDVTNVIDNTTTALIDGGSVSAGTIGISSSDTSTINTLAGAAALSGGASVGAAMAINTMTNETTARTTQAVLTAGAGGATITATSGETINTAAVAGAGSGGVAVAGSIAVNVIANTTRADVDGSSVLAGTSGNVTVAAQDTATISSASGSAAIGGGTSVGVGASSNTITNTIEARIRGVALSGAGGYKTVTGNNVVVSALSRSRIQSLAAGIAADATAGVGGSASINVIGTNVRSVVDRSADVLADDNALITADSNDNIYSIAGSAGIGIAAAGVGVATGVAVVTGETSAIVGGNNVGGIATKLDARANGGTSTITTGEITSVPTATLTNPSAEYILGNLSTTTQNVSGVAVTAQAMRHFANGAFSLGGGSVGVGGTINANAVAGTTEATIQGAQVNQRGGADTDQDVNVIAASHTYGSGFAGAVGVGAYAGVGVAIEGSGYNVATKARILNSTTSATNNATVKARATEGIATLDAGGGFGTVGVQGTANIGIMRGSTEAVVYGGTLSSDALTVKADHDANFGSFVGAVSGGAVGVAGSIGVLVNAHTTTARIGASTTDGSETDTTTINASAGNVVVDAESQTNISQTIVSGSAGGFAFAGAIGVTVLDDTALATVNKTTMNTPAGNVTVEASVDSVVQQAGGAAAIGFGGGGVGASLGLALVRGQADAWIANSNITANNVTVDAKNTQDLDALSAAGGFDLTAGIGGSIQISMIGLGSSTTGSKADSELAGVTALDKANTFATQDRIGGEQTGGSVDQTNSSKTGFSTSSKNAVNSANSYDFKAKMNSPLANTTRARISNSTIATTTAVDVTATSATALRNSVGAAGVGLAAGVAAGISVAKVSNLVTASIDSASLLQGRSASTPTVTVKALAKDKDGNWGGLVTENRDTIVNRAIAAGGALGGAASAAVAVGVIDNTITANLDAGSLGGGAVTVHATDETNAEVDAMGAQVGGGTFGVAVAVANRSGSVTADFTPTGNSTITSANVQALGKGAMSANVLAASGGVGFAVSGNVADVRDSLNVVASIGAGASFNQTGGLTVKALHQPNLAVDVAGVGISAGFQAGVSSATAVFSGDTTASVDGTGAFGSGASLVVAQNQAASSGSNIDAYALSAGGGLLLGANGAVAYVEDSSDVSATWVADALPSGNITVEALRATSQHAEGTAYSGGIVGVGAVVSTSKSTGNTEAKIDGLTVASTGRTANITVNANAGVNSRAEATAGTGGVIAGSAAVANNILTGSTVAALNANSGAAFVRGNNVNVTATRRNEFNGRVDTVNASVVGASGAFVNNTVNTSTTAEVGAGTNVRVNNFTLSARSVGVKDWWSGSVNGTPNIKSASGGLIDAPSSTSSTDYRQTTAARINNNAVVAVDLDNGLGSDASVVRLDASSDITLRDNVVMNSGGAIPVATGVSKQEVKQDDNSVLVGNGAQIIAPRGNIYAGSRTDTDLDARVSVDTYGLAGAPDGVAWAKYTGTNTLTIDENALVQASRGNIYLGAGVNSSGLLNKFLINSDVHTWNKTAIPIAGGPDAVSELNTNSLVILKAGSIVEAGTDIDMVALTGTDDVNLVFGVNSASKVTSVGIGKDVYRELAAAVVSGISNAFGGDDVSFDIKKNTITRNTHGTVQIDAGATARVGLSRSEKLVIDEKITSTGKVTTYDENGVETGQVDTYDVGYTITTRTGGIGTIDSAIVTVGQETWNRILWLRQKEVDYAGTTEALGYANERKFLESRLVDQGLATRNQDGTIDFGRGSTGGLSPRAMAQAQLDLMNSQKAGVQNTLTEKLTAKTTVETTYTNIGSLITKATAISQGQGVIAGDATSLTALAAIVTTKTTAKTTADSNLTTATNTYNTRVTEQAAAQAAHDTCVATKDCNTATTLSALNTANTNLTSATTAKTSAQTAATTAATELTTAQGNVTTKQNTINTWIGEFNTLQTTLAAAETNQNLEIISQVTGITTYANQITQANINTFSTEKTTYNTNVVTVKVTDYNNWNASAGQLLTDITNLSNKISSLSDVAISGSTTTQLTIPNIGITLGDIRIQGNTLKGGGNLSAPGDASVTITNNSSAQLKVKDISISSTGGNIRLNGFLVDNNADINKINDVDGAASGASFNTINTRRSGANLAEIKINSTYDPNNVTEASKRRPSPDIALVGNIFNPEGLVSVKSQAGSILSQGNIRAGIVDIQATNGDFVQSYQNGFFHVGSDPQYRYQDSTKINPMGIVANGAILLNARYLNINGNVQSGIANWQVTLGAPSTMYATGDAAFFGVNGNEVLSFRAAYLNNRGSGTVPASGTGSRYKTFTGTAGLQVTYDAETDELYAGYTQTAAAISAPGGMYRMKASSATDNIGYSYDSVNDRFVIDGTAVKGGYIKMFGQIMNTEPNTTTAKDANGVSIYNGSSTPSGLKVMDGYGSITVTNNSGKKVVLGNIDAGTGAMGVIEISDIQSVNATTQVPSVKHTTITRDADGHVLTKQWWNNDAEPTTWTSNAVGRTWSYAPQAGMRYQYTTGTDESTIREYQRVTRNFFNADSLGVDEWYQGELIRGPFIQNKYDIPGGQRLILGSGLTDYFNNTSTTLANGTPTMTILRQWSECDPWLCITSRKYTQYRVTTPTKTIYYNTVKADYSIPINFIGSDAGTISVISNADLLLQGSLRNINGTTTLNATAGSIKSIANTSNITSKAVVLQASGSVGGAEGDGGPIRLYSAADVNHPANGVPNLTLSGYANGGNFTARHFSANTVLGDISSSGTISIMAKGNILSGGATSELTAQRVELNSSEGSIGSITGDAPINLRIKSTDDPNLFTSYGVKAQAYGDINLYSQTHGGSASGDMLVESVVSGTGNVRLKSDGKILDGNPVETIDERTWNQLLSYWDSVQLRGAASVEKQDAMVASYVANVNRDYQNYWEIRARQEAQTTVATYDAGYTYTLNANEIAAFTEAGLSAGQIAQYQTDKTADYHRLHARMTTLESSAGSLTTSYSAGFSYQVVTDPGNVGAGALLKTGTLASGASTYANTEVTGMLKGSSWSDKELGIALTPGLLKEVTNTNVIVKAPNVRGNTIELFSNAGIGDRVSPGLNIDLAGDPSKLTNAQKVALAAAERSDLSMNGSVVTVLQNKPLNVLGSNLVAEGLNGGLSTGNIFIASRGGIAVNSIQTSKELRLKVIGNLTNGTNAANVAAINANIAILESGDNGIGSAGSLLRVASNGTNSSYVARANAGVYMAAPTGNLNIDTVYSPGDIVLFSTAGAISAAFADTAMDIRGKSVNLQAAGNIGSSTHFFDVGVDPDQLITAKSTGGGIYLRGTEGAAFNLGNVDAVTDVVIDGFINPVVVKNNINTTGNISITGGKDIEFKSGVSVTSGIGSITVEAGDDVLVNTGAVVKAGNGASVGGDNITINGTLTTQTGNIRVNADEGDVVLGAGGLVRAVGVGTLDVIAASDILMNVSSQMISGGLARLNAKGGEIQASSVQGGSVEANALTTIQGIGSGNIHFRATDLAGSVWLNRRNDSSQGLVTGTGIGTGTQALRVSAVNGYATTQTGDIDMRLERASTFGSIATGGGDITVTGAADITAQTVSATGDIDISNSAGNTKLTNMKTTAGSMKVNSAGTLYINDAKAPGGANFTSVGLATLGKIDTTGAGNVRADLTVNATQGITASNLIADDITLGSTNGALYVSAFDATGNVNASSPLGALTLYKGTAAGDITAVGQSVTSNSLGSTGGDVSLNAQGGNLTYTTITAADALGLTARDRITGNSAATAKAQNAVVMTANDITAGTVVSTSGGITLTGKTTDVLTAALSAGGSILVNANRNVSLTSTTGVANAGGEISATAATGTLNVTNAATSAGTMTLNSAKAMTVGTLTTTGTDSDMMITASAGALNFRTLDSKRHLTATVRDAIVRGATTGLGFKAGGNIVVAGGSINQLKVDAQGSVNISTKSGLTVDGNNNTGATSLLGATGASVNIKSAYDLISTGRIQSLSGDIDLEAGRNMTIMETFSFGKIGLKAVQNATLIKVQYGAGFFATVGGTLRVTTIVAPSSGPVVISATSVTGITPTP